jgi:hypothetical protein
VAASHASPLCETENDILLDNDMRAFETLASDLQSISDSPPADEEDVPVHNEDVRYVEECPESWKAGAAWGNDTPLFESIRREQETGNRSRWGPFESEEEWELGEWLNRNVGQKQTDAYLKLPIVCISLQLFMNTQ